MTITSYNACEKWSNIGPFPTFPEDAPFPSLPTEIASNIFDQLTTSELQKCATVSAIWAQYAARAFLFDTAFGKAKWQAHFGDVGVEPPLPANIQQILKDPCPFWPDKKVVETHMLVLIPATVDGKPFTLKLLGELIQKPKRGHATKYRTFYLGEYQDNPVAHSYWALMTKDVLAGSRDKNWKAQFAQVASLALKTGVYYVPPKVIEAATCLHMHHMTTGQRLYSDSPRTFTRCEEFYSQEDEWKIVVGGFSSGGLCVSYYRCGDESGGVGAVRKF